MAIALEVEDQLAQASASSGWARGRITALDISHTGLRAGLDGAVTSVPVALAAIPAMSVGRDRVVLAALHVMH